MEQTLYFKNGILYKKNPDDGRNYYQARYFISDGIKYDFNSPEDITKMVIPNFSKSEGTFGDVTKSLDYVVRMKAGHFYIQGKYDLCSICLRKMVELMKHSNIGWSDRDFYRIVQWNIEMGNFKEAEKAENELNQFLYSDTPSKHIFLRNRISQNPEIMQEQLEYERKNRDRIEYYHIYYQLPKSSPKSFGAYRRMKNSKTSNFQKLLKIAEEVGIHIEM